MSDIGSKLRKYWLEIAWGMFSAANVAAIVLINGWDTVPFHFVWVSLTLVYGFRVWRIRTTWAVLAAVIVATGHAELITGGNPGSQAAQDAEVVLDELNRLSRISERLLILAAAEHPDFLKRGPIELEGFVSGTARRWMPTADRDWQAESLAEGTQIGRAHV